MRKRISLFIIFVISIFAVSSVDAQNSVDYTLTITNDYKFKEVIKYTLSDYEQIPNGYNYFSDIVSEDVYVDIMYKTKYKKTKQLKNGLYYVTLSYTHSEYTLSNSLFLNNCFENERYNYDIDKYSFSGTGGFNCLRADNLKITLITDFEVTNTNATVSGNKYIWNPTSNNFTMNIDINKTYIEKPADNNLGHGIDESSNNEPKEELPEGVDNYETDDPTNSDSDQEDNEKNGIFGTIIGIIILLTVATGVVIAVIVLKNKHNDLNKI